MRFLHTSDWHLGRLFHGVHLTEDQAHVLFQLVDLVADARVDAVIVAGDIYDRAVPPPDAVRLLDEVLARIVVGLKVPVLMIAGNHDSPERVGFGSRVLAQQNLHLAGLVGGSLKTVVLSDEHGAVDFHLIPYAEPSVVREKLSDPSAVDHSTAMRLLLDQARGASARARIVVVAHAFVGGGEECESERPLSVGGSGAVEATHFAGFNYVALGHLHRPQQAGGQNIIYSGSLMKYSFSEADHKKGIKLVELNERGQPSVEHINLSPRRDVRRIEGFLSDLLRDAGKTASKDDYLEVTLLDKGALLDPIGKLRGVYPNVLHLRRPEFTLRAAGEGAREDHRKIGDFDLFGRFFLEVTGEDLSVDQAAAYRSAVEKIVLAERETK